MEHITKEDLDWVVDEILGFANKFVYLNIACYPATKILPNGENAHVTQESPGWWLDLINGAKYRSSNSARILLAIDDEKKERIYTEL